tara:strand:+ start:33220 stop:34755 length:1536 start_codon:yes stop_codon:yes gene_type:complete
MKMKRDFLLLVFTFYTFAYLQGNPPDSVAMDSINPEDANFEVETDLKLFGDYYIKEGEVSQEYIRIIGGDLYVAGTAENRIIVLGGDVFVKSSAVINGEIVAIGGRVFTDKGAVINGKIVESNIREGIFYSEQSGDGMGEDSIETEWEKDFYIHRPDWIHPIKDVFVYNRNEGLVFTPIFEEWDRRGESSFKLSFSLGIRFGQMEKSFFSPSNFIGRMTLEKSFLTKRNLILFISGFKESFSDDVYRLPLTENTMAGIFARQDFYDRWDEEGYEGGLGIHFGNMHIRLAYRDVEIDFISITQKQARWFHSDREFRANPDSPGWMGKVLSYSGTLSAFTNEFSAMESGLGFILRGEQIIDFESFNPFSRYAVTIHANSDVTDGIIFRSRFMTGISPDSLPKFRQFGIGGLGSVSAFPFKYQIGNQMIQLNVELLLLPEFLDRGFLIALFTDIGNAWDSSEYSFTNFGKISENQIGSIGIGLGISDGDWRFNFTRPLDERDTWETTFRLNLNF